MDYIRLQQVCLVAINRYGHNAQFRQMQEECNELAIAISHYLRKREGAKEEVVEELADIYIYIRQLLLMLQCWDEFYSMVDTKVIRLEDNLANTSN